MEFQGRIKKLLPMRSGTSARTGNEWKALPFIFEYFEHPTDRYTDSVVLETFDANVIENLKEGMEVRCGFSHHTRDYEGRTYNELRLYKVECVKPAPVEKPAGTTEAPQNTAAAAPQQQGGGEYNDDLPF